MRLYKRSRMAQWLLFATVLFGNFGAFSSLVLDSAPRRTSIVSGLYGSDSAASTSCSSCNMELGFACRDSRSKNQFGKHSVGPFHLRGGGRLIGLFDSANVSGTKTISNCLTSLPVNIRYVISLGVGNLLYFMLYFTMLTFATSTAGRAWCMVLSYGGDSKISKLCRRGSQ